MLPLKLTACALNVGPPEAAYFKKAVEWLVGCLAGPRLNIGAWRPLNIWRHKQSIRISVSEATPPQCGVHPSFKILAETAGALAKTITAGKAAAAALWVAVQMPGVSRLLPWQF